MDLLYIITFDYFKQKIRERLIIMVIIYESKTGFTKKYAKMLADKANLIALNVKNISKVTTDEEILFLGWIKAGKIQGLNKLRKYNLKAVCASGTSRRAEPSPEVMIRRNKIEGIPFFYLRGGCLPVDKLKGLDKILLKMLLKILKSRKEKDEEQEEMIENIENGFDGVDEKNLEPVLSWLETRNNL